MKIKNTISAIAIIATLSMQNALAMERNYLGNQRSDVAQQQSQSNAQSYVARLEREKFEKQERQRKEAQNYVAQLERTKLEKQERQRKEAQNYAAQLERMKLEKQEKDQRNAQAAALLYESIQKSKRDNPPQEEDEELKRQDREDLEVILGLSTQEDVDRAQLLRQNQPLINRKSRK